MLDTRGVWQDLSLVLKGSTARWFAGGAVPGAEGAKLAESGGSCPWCRSARSCRIEALSPFGASSWLPGGVPGVDSHVQFSSPPLGKKDTGSRLGGLSSSFSDEKLGHRAISRSHCLICCRAGSLQLYCS